MEDAAPAQARFAFAPTRFLESSCSFSKTASVSPFCSTSADLEAQGSRQQTVCEHKRFGCASHLSLPNRPSGAASGIFCHEPCPGLSRACSAKVGRARRTQLKRKRRTTWFHSRKQPQKTKTKTALAGQASFNVRSRTPQATATNSRGQGTSRTSFRHCRGGRPSLAISSGHYRFRRKQIEVAARMSLLINARSHGYEIGT